MTVNKINQLGITIFIFLLSVISCKKPSNNECGIFIAHAGGYVDGHFRTNSLEGLNASYLNGFRMFELDFQLTTDNKIVATHDPIYVSEKEFLSTLIEEKFTPMNMIMINNWFEKHSDAILVTDKINTPKLMAEQFKFKNRMIMELFTWETISEAIELGITPMVSQDLFWETPDIENRLNSLNIKYIGMHRNNICKDKELLRKLKEKGFKTYIWFTQRTIDGMEAEEYVLKNDMDYCFGIYADILIDCSTNK